MVDLSNPLEFIRVMINAVQQVLLLNPEIFARAFAYQGPLYGMAIWIAFIGGVSMELGQSVVLFANRVSGARYWVSILLGAIRYVFSVLVTVTVFWIIANLVGEKPWPYTETARAISLAYAPYWLAILILIPTFGIWIEKGLNIWVFLAFIVASQSVFQVSFLIGVVGAVIALVTDRGVGLILGKILTPVADRLVLAITGRPEIRDLNELYAEFATSPSDGQ